MPKKPQHFKSSTAAEAQFAKALRKVGRVSGHIVEAHVEGAKIKNEREMNQALEAYSKLITPWAARQSAKMLEKVSRSNKTAYQKSANIKLSIKQSREMARQLKNSETERNVRQTAAKLMDEQVALIKSLPLRAGLRAQQLAREAAFGGGRASDIAEIIQELDRSGEVSESDAMRIARTEVARSNASLTQARAASVGARGYIWRTTMDGAERHSHAEMNGKFVEYAHPPTLSDGTKGHAGTFVNCRCYQEPQFDEAD